MPCPAITRRSSNGGISAYPRSFAILADASIRAASVGATATSSAPTLLIRSVLTVGAFSGTTIAAGRRSRAAA